MATEILNCSLCVRRLFGDHWRLIMQAFCESCFQSPMDCRCIMSEPMECPPMPRGGYHDYGVTVHAQNRPIMQPNYAGDTEQRPVRMRSIVPPASIVGMVKRWNAKYRMYSRLQIDATNRPGGFNRARYWNSQGEKWFRKAHRLIEKHPEYKIDWPLK